MADIASGYGQQDPADSSGEFNKHSFLIQQALARISTAKPVKVMAVDASAKTVDVQPMVNQVDGQNNATPHGTINAVPYLVLQYGPNAVVMTPAVGDRGVMICADRDISAVVATRDVAPPGSYRKLDAADGIFIGGILNDDPTQWVKFTDDGIEITDKNANHQTFGEAGISINGVLFNRAGQVEGNLPVTGALQLAGVIESVSGDPYSQSITTSADITSTGGEVRASGIPLSTHRHTQSGGGDTGEPFA